MNALEYAQLEDSMDYLYDFFDEDLEARVRAEREYLPESLQDLSLIHISEPTRPY